MSLASPGSPHRPLSQCSCMWGSSKHMQFSITCCSVFSHYEFSMHLVQPLGYMVRTAEGFIWNMDSAYWHALAFSFPHPRRYVGLQLGLYCSKVQTCNWFWVWLVWISNDSGRRALGSAEQTAATSYLASLQEHKLSEYSKTQWICRELLVHITDCSSKIRHEIVNITAILFVISKNVFH